MKPYVTVHICMGDVLCWNGQKLQKIWMNYEKRQQNIFMKVIYGIQYIFPSQMFIHTKHPTFKREFLMTVLACLLPSGESHILTAV